MVAYVAAMADSACSGMVKKLSLVKLDGSCSARNFVHPDMKISAPESIKIPVLFIIENFIITYFNLIGYYKATFNPNIQMVGFGYVCQYIPCENAFLASSA